MTKERQNKGLLEKQHFLCSPAMSVKYIAKNDEISPHFCWGNFGEILIISFPKGEMEISVSLKFPIETCPFPLNFNPRTMGKFWYFLLWYVSMQMVLASFC